MTGVPVGMAALVLVAILYGVINPAARRRATRSPVGPPSAAAGAMCS